MVWQSGSIARKRRPDVELMFFPVGYFKVTLSCSGHIVTLIKAGEHFALELESLFWQEGYDNGSEEPP